MKYFVFYNHWKNHCKDCKRYTFNLIEVYFDFHDTDAEYTKKGKLKNYYDCKSVTCFFMNVGFMFRWNIIKVKDNF
jgi:hypothetical protein